MVFWWGCQVRIVCRRGGGGPPRGALAGVVKELGGEAGATPESPMCDLDYEKNRGFFTIS